jgi:hypothetical protein
VFSDVIFGGCPHFLSAGCIELNVHAILGRGTVLDDSRACDIAIGDDNLVVQVNDSIRVCYLHLVQARTRSIFGQPYFKSNGRLDSQIVKEEGPHSGADEEGGGHH